VFPGRFIKTTTRTISTTTTTNTTNMAAQRATTQLDGNVCLMEHFENTFLTCCRQTMRIIAFSTAYHMAAQPLPSMPPATRSSTLGRSSAERTWGAETFAAWEQTWNTFSTCFNFAQQRVGRRGALRTHITGQHGYAQLAPSSHGTGRLPAAERQRVLRKSDCCNVFSTCSKFVAVWYNAIMTTHRNIEAQMHQQQLALA
jgi:hypothetical protein